MKREYAHALLPLLLRLSIETGRQCSRESGAGDCGTRQEHQAILAQLE